MRNKLIGLELRSTSRASRISPSETVTDILPQSSHASTAESQDPRGIAYHQVHRSSDCTRMD